MLPLYPPYPITDLAHEHLEGRLPDGRPRRHPHRDPDGFVKESAELQADPVFMGLRKLVTTGPVGWLVQWSQRKFEARQARRYGSRVTEPGNMPRAARPADAEDRRLTI